MLKHVRSALSRADPLSPSLSFPPPLSRLSSLQCVLYELLVLAAYLRAQRSNLTRVLQLCLSYC